MWPFAQAVFLGILLEYGAGQDSNDGYTDENRPYEFGFVIEGEQHRYEKKDEKGIIMGEFGFITADGVYHLTVYATDEDGNFRILKTKNTKIGFPMTTTSTTPSPKPALRKQEGLRGCSGCLIPTTSSVPPLSNSPKSPIQQNNGQGILQKPYGENEQLGRFGGRGSLQGSVSPQGGQPGFGSPDNRPVNVKNLSPDDRSKIQAQPKSDGFIRSGVGFKRPENALEETPDINRKSYPSKGFVQQSNDIPPPVPKSTQTLTKTEEKMLDFLARLYKFNYTLTYHGHEEEGDIAGNKRGSYFNNGRDGYQRKIVYIANEFGYQPMVMLIKLNADETPNELTEKELTQLKGSEFKWFFNKIKN